MTTPTIFTSLVLIAALPWLARFCFWLAGEWIETWLDLWRMWR